MNDTVYADLLFMIDFSMDFLTFYIVARLLRQKPKIIRMCSASAMGGVYSVISLGINVGGVLALVFDVFVCFVMCMTVFLEKDPKRFRKMPLYTLLYFTVSALLGGTMTVIYGFLNRRRPNDAAVGRGELSLWVFGLVALLGGLVTLFGGNLLGRTSRTKIGRLTVRLGARKVTFEAMSDSGNLLRDPIGGKDVVVVDGRKARNIVPSLALLDAGALPDEMKRRVRMIPVRTASGEGLLEAFVPDDVLLLYDGEERHIDVLIAVSKSNFDGGECEAIVPADYFT